MILKRSIGRQGRPSRWSQRQPGQATRLPVRAWVGLAMGVWSAMASLGSLSLGSPFGIALAQTHDNPFAGQGVVYVWHQEQWREALIRQSIRRLVNNEPVWFYLVEMLDGAQELRANIPSDRLRTIQQAQAEGLTTQVYDLSSQAGIDEMLARHNEVRQLVGVAPLRWSPELAAAAQAWAEVLLENNAFEHSPDWQRRRGTIGENLHQRRGPAGWSYATPSRAVAGWIREGTYYNYTTNSCTPGRNCGHYLQMVWAESQAVGCGMARAAEADREVWACRYDPGGIVLNQRPY